MQGTRSLSGDQMVTSFHTISFLPRPDSRLCRKTMGWNGVQILHSEVLYLQWVKWKVTPLNQMENVLQDFGTVSSQWKQIWLRRVQGDFETMDYPEAKPDNPAFVCSRATLWGGRELLLPLPVPSFPLKQMATPLRWKTTIDNLLVGGGDTLKPQLFFRWWERSMQSGDPISIWRISWTNELK